MPTVITKIPGPTSITAPSTAREAILVMVPTNTRAVGIQGFDDEGLLPADVYLDTEGTEGQVIGTNAWTISGEQHYEMSDVTGRRRTNLGGPVAFYIASAVPNGRIELFLIRG